MYNIQLKHAFLSSFLLILSVSIQKRKNIFQHTLIALTFLKKPPECLEVHHRNHIREDNSVLNLQWVTTQENISYEGRPVKISPPIDNLHHGSTSCPQNEQLFLSINDCQRRLDEAGLDLSLYRALKDHRVKKVTLENVVHKIEFFIESYPYKPAPYIDQFQTKTSKIRQSQVAHRWSSFIIN